MGKVIFGNLQSKLMRRNIPYRIILPTQYYSSKQNYPVLYLLHGLFGNCDNWLDLTGIVKYAKSFEAIIVTVEGGNGWYSDSKTDASDKFESYIIEELIPEISLKLRTENRKEKRAIAGLSMGGYGSFKFAIKRPDLFCFVGSMSGALIAPTLTVENQGGIWDELLPSINEVFGDKDSLTRQENDLFRLISKCSTDKIKELPFFYFDCGIEDTFLEANREFADIFQKRNIQFEYHEVSGGHDWDYWDKQIKVILSLAEFYLVGKQ
ncbi:MAG: alpha/beta hydrolase family protein [Acidobacteriota bacterium]